MRTETHPHSKSDPKENQGKQPNEGEGNRTAAKQYNQQTEKFAQSGKVKKSAEKAERAIESGEREELERAERVGRRPARS